MGTDSWGAAGIVANWRTRSLRNRKTIYVKDLQMESEFANSAVQRGELAPKHGELAAA
jgi:hypothetical protein